MGKSIASITLALPRELFIVITLAFEGTKIALGDDAAFSGAWVGFTHTRRALLGGCFFYDNLVCGARAVLQHSIKSGTAGATKTLGLVLTDTLVASRAGLADWHKGI